MLTTLLVLGLFSAPPTKDEADITVTAHLEMMKLAYVCDRDVTYKVEKKDAIRTIEGFGENTSFTVKDVTALDRALTSGKAKLSKPIDLKDCENLLIDARADLRDIDSKHRF